MGGVKTTRSSLIIVDSISVGWGDVSICDAEIILYDAVVKSSCNYSRVHLLSGVDLPLKSQNEIHDFFNIHKDLEFIDLRRDEIFEKRMKYYYFFFSQSRNSIILTFLRRMLLLPQTILVNRLKNCPLQFAYGSNWASLTLRAVKEIVIVYKKYRKLFLYTSCSDEHFQQMILLSNGSFHFFPKGNVRYIDWSQHLSSPKNLTIEDFDSLVNSDCLFARKFDMNVDLTIIQKIINKIHK